MMTFVVLFVGAFVAAAVSGAAGFGGALLLLPLLVYAVGPVLAVPLLTIAQLVGNVSRVGFGFRQIRWRPVGLFLLGAIPLSVVGAFSFLALSPPLVKRVIGVMILLYAVLAYMKVLTFTPGSRALILGGGLVGFLSGLVGSAGPLGAAIFLSLKLHPVAYIASEATTALVMHGVKTLIYQRSLHLDARFWELAFVLGLAMIAGTWIGKRFIERMTPERFQRFVLGLLVTIALYMVIAG